MNAALSIIFLLCSVSLSAQYSFRSPLDVPLLLTGNFGELRNSHFHAGLDIATQGTEGLKIYACESGYVSRIRVGPYGYGHALYIKHDNGLTTVYGHLSKFNTAIGDYVRAHQYNKESFELDIPLNPEEIRVAKGDVVAYSGNSGSSGGPHLHFEVRRGDTPLNPMNFGFTIGDDKFPEVGNLYVYPQYDGYPAQRPQRVALIRSGNTYRPAGGVVYSGGEQIGFGLYAWDCQNGRNNRNGVYKMEMKVDGETLYKFSLDSISFGEKKYINAHVDYKEKVVNKKRLHRLFRLPGNKISWYEKDNGLISVSADQSRDIQITLQDHKGNTTKVEFALKLNSAVQPQAISYLQEMQWDQDNYFYSESCIISFPPNTLYDDLYLDYHKIPGSKYSDFHEIDQRFTPLHKPVELSIETYNLDKSQYEKAVVILKDHNGNTECIGGHIENGFIKCETESLGGFYVDLDNTAPKVTPINISEGKNLSRSSTIRFSISDNLSGIKSWRAEVDGTWILMKYDPKRRLLYHEFDGKVPPGEHQLVLSVIDARNNSTARSFTFIR
ncbi:MAG: hypothetical protein ACI959_002109 [Limisphaerales bacterium]|jgi:hypothetical protein